MNTKLKVYRGNLLVKGPVFIGSGRSLNKKEYVLLNGGSGIGVVDQKKAYNFFMKKGLLGRYEDFMMRYGNSSLSSFLNSNHLKLQDIRSCFAYELDAGDELRSGGRETQIWECVKDPYGYPYVPGSSLKGMLRTILLADKIMRDPVKYSRDRNQIQRGAKQRNKRSHLLSDEMGELESRAFPTLNRPDTGRDDAVNDALSGLIISDSRPLSMKDCVVCKKIDVHVPRVERPLPIARECLRPGTRIEFDITIDTSVLDLNADNIMNAVKRFNSRYKEAFESKFNLQSQITDRTVFLGGGSGFVSKTILYPLLGSDDGLYTTADVLQAVSKRGSRHYEDPKKGVSPRVLKCTHYQGRLLEMGACDLSFT